MSRQRQRSPSPGPSASKRFRTNGNDNPAETSDLQLLEVSQTPSSVIERQIKYDLDNNIRSGRVIKIVVKNLMCHRHFEIDFNKRTNLMIGSNGSGKSAILAALTIGLGYNAALTGRYTTVKQLIKHGESQMFIQITLENGSFDGYDKERYGNLIIVERTVHASGSSSYKLKNEWGQVVGTSRVELQRILVLLNIQVDNPICVLNQESAREFLRDSNEGQQYKFFLKATQIEESFRIIAECTATAESSQKSLALRKKGLAHSRQELEKLTEKYNTMVEANKMKDAVDTYKVQLAWRFVADRERDCQQLSEQLQQLVTAIAEEEDYVKNRASSDKLVDQRIQRLLVDIEGKKTNCEEVKTVYGTTRTAINSLEEQLGECKRQINRTKERITRQEEDIKTVEADLEQRRNGGTDRVAEEKRKNTQELDELKSKKSQLIAIIESAKRDIEITHHKLNQLRDVKEEKAYSRVAKQNEAERVELELRQFDLNSKNKLSLYGNRVPALDAKIRQLHQQGKFDELPRGPLGQYIELRDHRWSSVVETILGNMLHAFCTSTHDDRRRLLQLIRSEFPELANHSIITVRFIHKPHDVSKGCVAEADGTHLLMNLIKVSDPVVLNCLIDHVHPETILIAEQSSVAMANTSVRANVPRNLSRVIVTNPPAEFYPQPNYRSYDLRLKPARYLQNDMEQLKLETRHRVERLRRDLEELNSQCKAEQHGIAQQEKILRERQDQLLQQQRQLARCEQRTGALNSIVYPAEQEEASLQAEIASMRNSLEQLDKTIHREQEKQDQLIANLREQEAKLLEKRQTVKTMDNEVQELQRKIELLKQQRYEQQTNSKAREQNVQRLSRERDEFQLKCTSMQEAIRKAEEEAKAIGDRVNSEQTVEQLKKVILVTQTRLRQVSFVNEDIKDVKSLLELKQIGLTKTEEYVTRFDSILQRLKYNRMQQCTYINKLTSQMIIRMKHKFKLLMKIRNYDGNIQVDRQNNKLSLSVVPRDRNVVNAVSSTKSLSGGERSFSTVTFLIALWSCVDTPFYFLDEYDVFTDDVTRHTLTQLLLNEAHKKPDRQFCFLTPQSMSSVESDENLTIHRMPEPVRCPK